MSLLAVRATDFSIDIRQGDPWFSTLVARRWCTASRPDRRRLRLHRVLALTGRRMTKQARPAGAHEGCEPPHASDDARLDLWRRGPRDRG